MDKNNLPVAEFNMETGELIYRNYNEEELKKDLEIQAKAEAEAQAAAQAAAAKAALLAKLGITEEEAKLLLS